MALDATVRADPPHRIGTTPNLDVRSIPRDGLPEAPRTIRQADTVLEQVAAGVAYCIAPESMARFYARPDLVWIPIVDIEPLRTAPAWCDDDSSPLLHAFAGVVRELAIATAPAPL